MSVLVEAEPYGSPYGTRYDPGVAKTERMSVERTRPVLGQRLVLAKEEGVHTVIARHGEDEGVLVPMDWYRKARACLEDPTDL